MWLQKERAQRSPAGVPTPRTAHFGRLCGRQQWGVGRGARNRRLAGESAGCLELKKGRPGRLCSGWKYSSMRRLRCVWSAGAEQWKSFWANLTGPGASAVCLGPVHRSKGTTGDWDCDTDIHRGRRARALVDNGAARRLEYRTHDTSGAPKDQCHRSSRSRSH